MASTKPHRVMTVKQLRRELRRCFDGARSGSGAPLALAQTAHELWHKLPESDDPQALAGHWVEEQKRWPYRQVWLLDVRPGRMKRRIRPIIIRPAD